ncbi:MAG: chalcone isomerase family protein [Planctomycetes bacterium]|nr:chalcone isomerase family protein [Planctomycetota bacterium]
MMLFLIPVQEVQVEGSRARFKAEIDEEGTRWVLTGAGERIKSVVGVSVKVYAVGSYVREGARFESPQELAEADIPKKLLLVMERELGGASIVQAFEEALSANYPQDAFPREFKAFHEYFADRSVAKGDCIQIRHLPKQGLEIRIPGENPLTIENVKFSQALWEIYFGKNCLSEELKVKLFSRPFREREPLPIRVWAVSVAFLAALCAWGLRRRAKKASR